MLEGIREKAKKECPEVLASTATGFAKSATGIVEDTLEKIGQFLEKLNQFIEAFKDVLPTINSLGLSIELINLNVGLLPEAEIRISGRVQDIEEGKLGELIKAKSQNSMLVPILHALRSVALLEHPLEKVGFQGIRIDIHIVGAIPNLHVEFLRSV